MLAKMRAWWFIVVCLAILFPERAQAITRTPWWINGDTEVRYGLPGEGTRNLYVDEVPTRREYLQKARYGVYLNETHQSFLNWQELKFNALTAPPYTTSANNVPRPGGLFCWDYNAGKKRRFDLDGTKPVWTAPTAPAQGASSREYEDNGKVDIYTGYATHRLYRYFNMTDDNLPGITPEKKRYVILIHGWNTNSYKDQFGDPPWQNVHSNIQSFFDSNGEVGAKWKVLQYHMEADLDTGWSPVDAVDSAEAAETARMHGYHLATLILEKCPEVEAVQFIAHSAGAWAARSAFQYLACQTSQASEVRVQITLLDAYIPGSVFTYGADFIGDTTLTKELMSAVKNVTFPNRIFGMDNYFNKNDVPGTEESFDWGNFFLSSPGNVYTENKDGAPWNWKGHDAPNVYYADSVTNESTGGTTNGWRVSMAYKDIRGGGLPPFFYVRSSHGVPEPGIGQYVRPRGTVLTNSVASPVLQGSDTKHVCTGWSMTGNAPLSGTTNTMIMTLTNDVALTWLWSTNYYVSWGAQRGTITNAGSGSWYPAGSTVTLSCIPSNNLEFIHWIGDVPAGMATNNPLTFIVDRPRNLTAQCAVAAPVLKISFPGYNRSETLTNFPVLVALDEGISGFRYADFAFTNGVDLRFYDATTTNELPYEVERWNPGGTSHFWVRAPRLSVSENHIWARWGDPGHAIQPPYTTNGAVWATDYRLVMHMQNNHNSRGNFPTENVITETAVSYTSGQIGSAAVFNGTTSHFTIDKLAANTLCPDNHITLSAWIKPKTLSYSAYSPFYMHARPDSWHNFSITGDGTYLGFGLHIGGIHGLFEVPITPANYTGVWHLVTAVYDGSAKRLYRDGVEIGSTSVSGAINEGTSSATAYIGTDGNGHFFEGALDEFRISDAGRSSNWVWACYMNQKAGSTFLSHALPYSLSMNPGPLMGGNVVTVTYTFGSLGNGSDITSVRVGGALATITGQGTNWVTVTMPAAESAGVKDIVIESTSAGHKVLTDAYTYHAAGVISGVTPSSCSVSGGYSVTIRGSNLGSGSDVTHVSLCGASVSSIVSQSATQIVVTAGAKAGGGGRGDVYVSSVSYGTTTQAAGFEYIGPVVEVLGTDGKIVTHGAAASRQTGTDFGCLVVGTSLSHTLSITNAGTAALNISGRTITGMGASAFTVTELPSSLAAGATHEFEVRYAPTQVGIHDGILQIANAATNYTLNLRGSACLISANVGPYAGGNSVTLTNITLGSGSGITNLYVGGVSAIITGQGADWVTFTMPACGLAGVKDILIETVSAGDVFMPATYTVHPPGLIGGVEGWSEVASLPGPRWGLAAGVLNDTLYALGGKDGATPTANVFRYDGANWTEMPGLPAARSWLAAGTLNGGLYAVGGEDSLGVAQTNVYRYNGTNWTEIAGLPAARRRLGVGVLNGALYAVGGEDSVGVAHTNVYRYNGTNWTETTGVPAALAQVQMFEYDSLYAGGSAPIGGVAQTNVYHFGGSGWVQAGVLPITHSRYALGLLNDTLYTIGGCTGNVYRTDVYQFDGLTWTNALPLPVARCDMVVKTANGALYAMGGYNGTAHTNVYRYGALNSGISPLSGSLNGGYTVTISGNHLGNGNDITHVSLCDVPVASILSQSATQVVVVAGASAVPCLGAVRVLSASYGETVKSNAFNYIRTKFSLTIQSLHGNATPPPGIYTNNGGTTLGLSVGTPATHGTTQYVCMGWQMTGNAPLSGPAADMGMTVTNDAVLAWQWTTNYYVGWSAQGGTVTNEGSGAWRPAGSTLTVTCAPLPGWQFVEWTGDVPQGMATDNPLTFTADRGRSIAAKCSLPSSMAIAFPGYGRAEALTNFPLLVVLNNGVSGFRYDQFASTNGWDLRFKEAGQTAELPYEIERWDPQGTSYVWVRIPTLTSQTALQASWGNPSEAARPAYTTNGTVWAEDYPLVMHMQSAADSSANRLGGAEANVAYVSGHISSACVFNGTSSKIEKDHSPALKPVSHLTISAWIQPESLVSRTYSEIYRKEDGDARQLLSFQDNGTVLSFGLGIAGTYSELDVSINASDYTNGWHLVTATYDGSVKRLYRDGVEIGRANIVGAISGTGTMPAYVGCNSGSSEWYQGGIDELRFSSTQRSCSSNWVWACYMSQKAGSTFSVYNPLSFRVVSSCGTPSPAAGTHTNGLGTTITASVVSPDTRGTTQYVCTGWVMTGNVPLSGATNVMSMTLTNDAVLTWLWATNVQFSGTAGPNGSLAGAANGWYPVGNSVTVTAVAAEHYHLASWSGDVPPADTNHNPLNVTLDRARSIGASFAANLSLNNTPNWWLAQHGLSTNAAGAVYEDGDGVPAWAEWVADTDPTNSASVFRLTDLALAPNRRVFFQSSSNRYYTLEYRTNLSSGVWVPVDGQSDVRGSGSGASLQDTSPDPARFYRVRVRP